MLTFRQQGVLHGILAGLTSYEIGVLMGVSARTVETHRRRIRTELGEDNLGEIARRFRHRLYPVPEGRILRLEPYGFVRIDGEWDLARITRVTRSKIHMKKILNGHHIESPHFWVGLAEGETVELAGTVQLGEALEAGRQWGVTLQPIGVPEEGLCLVSQAPPLGKRVLLLLESVEAAGIKLTVIAEGLGVPAHRIPELRAAIRDEPGIKEFSRRNVIRVRLAERG
jgi:DNA-binding CsgD family transcriptional regulator